MLKYDRRIIKAWAKSKFPFLIEKRISIALAIAALLLVFLFKDFFQAIAVMAAFIVIGIFSMIYNRWIKVSLGFELIMLGMVLTSVLYGRLPGFIVGALALFLAEMITDRFTYSTSVSFLGVLAVTMVAPSLNLSITWVGIWMTVLYDAVILPGYILLGSSVWRSLLFAATHILFNIWIFVFVAPYIFSLLS
ncbi:hypothetical protein HYX10_02745 [Candidatus Woesearchaeota archaeon]|nr:hypothetical protein [Candidatus Woesearchaeota archaeon]